MGFRNRHLSADCSVGEALKADDAQEVEVGGVGGVGFGGVDDHVHLLCRLARTITQAEWVKEIKRVSSLWLKEQSRDYLDFQWQGGYADFSVSQSNLAEVSQYIAEQEHITRK